MAARQMDQTDGPGGTQPTSFTLESPAPSPEPTPLEESQAEARSGRPKGLLTLLALLLAAGLGTATVLLVKEPLAATEQVVLISIATTVAFLGLVTMRWGWYVCAAVTAAFFGLNLYNLMTGADVFQIYRGSSYTFATLYPGVGVVVGAVAQLIYRIVGGE